MAKNAPQASRAADAKVLGVINERWLSAAEICKQVGVSDADSKVTYAIRRLRDTGAVDHCKVAGLRKGFRYLYRRKAND